MEEFQADSNIMSDAVKRKKKICSQYEEFICSFIVNMIVTLTQWNLFMSLRKCLFMQILYEVPLDWL